MKILMTCLLDWTLPSAGRNHFHSLARAFRDEGHDLTGLIPGHDTRDPFQRMIRIPVCGESLSGQAKLSFLHLQKLVALLHREKPDVLYYRFRSCSPLVVQTTRLVSPRTRIVTEFNNLPSDLLLMSGYSRWLAAMAKYTHIKCAHRSHLVRTLTETHRDILTSHGIDTKRIVVAGTGADLELFKPMDGHQSRAAMKLNPAHRYITFAGYLTRWQGVDTLIRAAPLINRNHPDVRFIIAGSGPQSENLRQLALESGVHDLFIFPGEIPYEHMPVLINASEICVGPMVTERSGQMTRSPMKLREYAACGKPAITVNVDGVKELAANGAAFLTASGDPEDFARQANQLLSQPDHIHRAGERALQFAQNHYSWKVIARQILSRMENLAIER